MKLIYTQNVYTIQPDIIICMNFCTLYMHVVSHNYDNRN